MKEGKLYEDKEIINEYLKRHKEEEEIQSSENEIVRNKYETFKVLETNNDIEEIKITKRFFKNESKTFRNEEPFNVHEGNADEVGNKKCDNRNKICEFSIIEQSLKASENDSIAKPGLNKETISLNGSEISQENSVENCGEEFREKGLIKFSNVSIYIKLMGYFFFFLILFTLFLMQFFKNFYDIWLNFYVSNEVILLISDFRTSIIILAGN